MSETDMELWKQYQQYKKRFTTRLDLFPALQRKPVDINQRAADMWSFAMVMWEMETREVPHADLAAMEVGMKVRQHHVLSLRVTSSWFQISERTQILNYVF